MRDQNPEPSRVSIGGRIKFWIAISSILGLCSLNIATLIDDEIHTAAYGGLRSGLEMLDDLLVHTGLNAVADRVTANGPTERRKTDVARVTTALTARNHELDRQLSGEKQHHQQTIGDLYKEKGEHQRLQSSHKELNAKHQKLTGDYNDLDSRHTALTQNHLHLAKVTGDRQLKVRSITNRMVPRIGGIALKSATTLPGRAIPYVGTATTFVFTAWELSELCQLIFEMKDLNNFFGNNFHDPNNVCGIPRPSVFGY